MNINIYTTPSFFIKCVSVVIFHGMEAADIDKKALVSLGKQSAQQEIFGGLAIVGGKAFGQEDLSKEEQVAEEGIICQPGGEMSMIDPHGPYR
ncbi:MAG: hypothetical protein IPJ06_16265 [Saprospiraceae bacterium]|nr:hypothetical protein [Saprospiraceae bacterium]